VEPAVAGEIVEAQRDDVAAGLGEVVDGTK